MKRSIQRSYIWVGMDFCGSVNGACCLEFSCQVRANKTKHEITIIQSPPRKID